MTGITLSYTITDGEVLRALLAHANGDLTAPMKDIGAALEESTAARFDTHTGPDGKPWQPSIRALMEDGQTLRKSGLLAASIHSEADSSSVRVGTNTPYAGVHQFGATIHASSPAGLVFQIGGNWARVESVTIPPRPFLGLDEDDEMEIAEILRRHYAPEGP